MTKTNLALNPGKKGPDCHIVVKCNICNTRGDMYPKGEERVGWTCGCGRATSSYLEPAIAAKMDRNPKQSSDKNRG